MTTGKGKVRKSVCYVIKFDCLGKVSFFSCHPFSKFDAETIKKLYYLTLKEFDEWQCLSQVEATHHRKQEPGGAIFLKKLPFWGKFFILLS